MFEKFINRYNLEDAFSSMSYDDFQFRMKMNKKSCTRYIYLAAIFGAVYSMLLINGAMRIMLLGYALLVLNVLFFAQSIMSESVKRFLPKLTIAVYGIIMFAEPLAGGYKIATYIVGVALSCLLGIALTLNVFASFNGLEQIEKYRPLSEEKKKRDTEEHERRIEAERQAALERAKPIAPALSPKRPDGFDDVDVDPCTLSDM